MTDFIFNKQLAQVTLTKTKYISVCIKAALFASTFSCLLAQSEPLEETNNEASPLVQIITQKQIEATGLNNLGDVINELAITRGITINQFNNNGGDGSVRTNIGNLGRSNVLVLLNGRRMATIGGDFDFSGLSLSFVKHIEINRNNPKSKYGVDAVSAVINIITQSGFTGIQANAYYGKSNQNDAETQNYNVSMGKTTERGSLFFNAEYAKNSDIGAGDRNISALPKYGTGSVFGSSATPQGVFTLFSPIDFNFFSFVTTPSGSNGWDVVNDPDLIPLTADSRFNFAPDNYLLTPQERKSIYVSGRYKINDAFEASSEILFNRRDSQRVFTPEPLFIGQLIGNRIGIDVSDIGGDNPYNPFGIDIPASNVYLIGRRLTEAGNRIFNNKVDTFHLSLDLTGSIEAGSIWDWNVNYVNSIREEQISGKNLVNKQQVAMALSNDCVADAACVPLDLFGGEGSITPQMLSYITQSTSNLTNNTTEAFNLKLSSDIAELLAGMLHFETAYQYRTKQLNQQWDALNLNNVGTNNRYFANTFGNYHVNDISVRFDVPLISNESGKSINLDVSSRYSKYNFTNGEVSGNLGLRFSANKTLQVNLDYAINRRAPDLISLFRDTSPIRSQIVDDPCDSDATLPGCPSGYVSFNNDFFPNFTLAGNNKLNLEMSEILQLNIKYQPGNLSGLSLNTKLYQQKIKGLLNKLGGQQILDTCAYTGLFYCDRITRLQDAPFAVSAIRTGYENNGSLKTSGIELTADYLFNTSFADFSINWQNDYLFESKAQRQNYADNSNFVIDFLGLENNATELPRLKSNLSASMKKQNLKINYQMRYVSGYEENCNISTNLLRPTNDPNAVGGIVPNGFKWCTYDPEIDGSINPTTDNEDFFSKRHAGGATFHDLNVSYDLPQYQTRIMLGVENVFDKIPPLSVNALANSYQTYLYNGTGRYFWIKFSKEF